VNGGRSASLWRWPVVLGVVTLFGLIAALLGEGGVWWALSWVALATPLVVALLCIVRSDRSR